MSNNKLFKTNKDYKNLLELINDFLESTGQSAYEVFGHKHTMRYYRLKNNSTGQRLDCRTIADLYDWIDYEVVSRTIKNHVKNYVRNSTR